MQNNGKVVHLISFVILLICLHHHHSHYSPIIYKIEHLISDTANMLYVLGKREVVAVSFVVCVALVDYIYHYYALRLRSLYIGL